MRDEVFDCIWDRVMDHVKWSRVEGRVWRRVRARVWSRVVVDTLAGEQLDQHDDCLRGIAMDRRAAIYVVCRDIPAG